MPNVTLAGIGKLSAKAARSRNTGPLTTRVTEIYQQLWRDAARVFVLATAEAMAVDTGMSVASLRPLAAQFRIKNILVAQFSGFGPKFHGYNYEGKGGGNSTLNERHDGAKGHKSMRRGEQMGGEGKAYKISFGSKSRLLMTFTFRAVVYQHILWDIRKWNSLEAGKAAMQLYLDKNINKAEYNVVPLIARWFSGGNI